MQNELWCTMRLEQCLWINKSWTSFEFKQLSVFENSLNLLKNLRICLKPPRPHASNLQHISPTVKLKCEAEKCFNWKFCRLSRFVLAVKCWWALSPFCSFNLLGGKVRNWLTAQEFLAMNDCRRTCDSQQTETHHENLRKGSSIASRSLRAKLIAKWRLSCESTEESKRKLFVVSRVSGEIAVWSCSMFCSPEWCINLCTNVNETSMQRF